MTGLMIYLYADVRIIQSYQDNSLVICVCLRFQQYETRAMRCLAQGHMHQKSSASDVAQVWDFHVIYYHCTTDCIKMIPGGTNHLIVRQK